MSRPVLHLLGCGRAARVIACWLKAQGQVEIGQVCNRSLASARAAVDFIGAGTAVDQLDEGITGGWLLLGLPDGALDSAALGLACRMPGQPELTFHLSGSTWGAILGPLGAPSAAIHPARAFADPDRALAGMVGTWLVAEGERVALDRLAPVFQAAGGHWLEIDAAGKALYHAATVSASNYLVTLADLARSLAEAAGLAPAQADDLLGSLQQGALDNLRGHSAASVLTGPIERSDPLAVARLLEAVDPLHPIQAELFRDLARATLALAVRKRGPKPGDEQIASLTSRLGSL